MTRPSSRRDEGQGSQDPTRDTQQEDDHDEEEDDEEDDDFMRPLGALPPRGRAAQIRGQLPVRFVDDCIPFTESSEFSKRITKAFRSRQDPNGISWGKVSDAIKATYWDEFNKYVTYEADLTERVKDEWKKRAPKRYANQMNKWKKKGKCPSYLDDEAWKNWEKLWADPKAQQLSITRARSRRGGVEAVPAKGTYTGGGISINETTRRLAERNNGKQPSQIQVLAYTHTKNHDGVTFVDQNSEYIYNRMHELREEMTQQNRQINATELYLQSLPPPKQGRRPYGSQFCCGGASTSTGSSSGEPSYGETVAMLRELQQQFNAMADEMKSLRTTLRTMGVRSPSDSPPQSPDPTADL